MRIHRAVRASLLVALLAISSPSLAQAPAPKWSAVDQAVGKENYLEAKKQADLVLQSGSPEDRQRTMMVYGRILLGLGQKDQARQYLNTFSGQGSGRKGRQPARTTASGQPAIYEAWLRALDKKPDEAIKTLEKMLEQSGNAPDETTAEAADVLAMLYMARGEHDKAKKAVDFGLKILKYRGTKGGYVLALLKGRLNSDFTAGEAKRLYNEAEKLREKGKFVEASQLFAQVRAMYPKNQWGHASGFRIGQCFLSLNQPAKAIDWWQKFVKESPAGPWRGQAHVGLVDVTLESELNLKAATEHALAASTTLAKLGTGGAAAPGMSPSSADAEPSWKDAAYDIHLRQGIVSLVDGRFDAAVQGFQQARGTVPSGGKVAATANTFSTAAPGLSPSAQDVQAGLDRLIEAAQNRVKLIPDDLIGDDRATVALVLGNIYNILRQYDVAKGWFSLPLNGSLRSRSAGHRSFAGLGLARVLVATASKDKSLAQAAIAYEASLKEYPKGSWHDETLRELALLIERAAAEQFGAGTVPSGGKESATAKASSAAAPGLSPSARAAPLTEAARQQQKKTLIAARAAALPFWSDIPSRYPTSRHVPQALYHAGVLYTEIEKSDEALAAFEELAKKYPDSPWTGDAHVRLIDVKLEHQFDLPGARNHADAAVAWYERLDQAKAAQARKGIGEEQSDALRSVKQLGYDIFVRAGLVEYLLEHPERAVSFFEKAKPLQPERHLVVVYGRIPTGIERLIEAAKSGKSLTPEVVRQGDEKAKLILMLADVYHEGEQWQRSLDLCGRVISGTAPKATREQKSYAHFKRGRNYYCLDGKDHNPDAAFTDYAASVRTAPKAPWADKAMFKAANIQWNHKHDAEAAALLWERLCRTYPESEEAIRSAYYVGIVYEWSNRPEEAVKAFKKLLDRWPDSPFTVTTRDHLTKLEAASPDPKHRKNTK